MVFQLAFAILQWRPWAEASLSLFSPLSALLRRDFRHCFDMIPPLRRYFSRHFHFIFAEYLIFTHNITFFTIFIIDFAFSFFTSCHFLHRTITMYSHAIENRFTALRVSGHWSVMSFFIFTPIRRVFIASTDHFRSE
jgi:hypothetical protein